MRAGKYAKAHKAFTESLEIKERVVGRKSIQSALSLMNLGDNYLLWGKLDEAEAAGREALKIRQSPKDPEAKYARELLCDIKKAREKQKRSGKQSTTQEL